MQPLFLHRTYLKHQNETLPNKDQPKSTWQDRKNASAKHAEKPPKIDTKGNVTGKKPSRLIEEEKVEKGRVRMAVYKALFRSFGCLPAVTVVFFLLLYSGANMASGFWLSEWTNDAYLKNETNKGTGKYSSETNTYIGIYAAIVLVQILGNAAFVMLTNVQMVSASQRLHSAMLTSIFHQSVAFFETTPSGRILNRFSREVDVLDVLFARQLWTVLHTFLSLVITVVIISYTTPIFLVVIPPILIVYIMVQRFYIPSSRQFRRLESTSRSPILSHFAETIHGASSIRAFGASDRFFKAFQNKVDTNNKCTFISDSAARWLKVRLEFLSSLLVFFASLFAVTSHGVSASLVALSVTYALQVTASLNMLVQRFTMLETNCVSAERIVEYISLPHEPEWINPDHRPSQGWPERGGISFVDYSLRYRPQLDLVLKSIEYTIEPGQKIGIVGRTGAGKSSLSLALFRVIEAAGGSIVIDDVDISTIGLHDLREGLTTLPQDPVLFSGTVRFNLDPFDLHPDAAIWKALDHAHLGDTVRELPGQLEYVCEEGGQNLSVGQRQLMCLARSLLRKTRILVLDEATAAVDIETDALLQETIRTEFEDCTVLTVAHRLNTVIDYDKIMVLVNGTILESGSPNDLLKNTRGTFYSMAKESGLVQ
ncbi:multidrug resistance-associated protein 1 [Plakobranchus ocellatus]|uniref:ABC-type glutathione-S-conjugate transporter n=1 Tax=Plakobranchus ocellatus TaxID=259542 RepID=A0AAV4D2I7_9GAST|nr:multidrug resistance-associated protein 1 [Plakobranchus ocellatus]